MVSQTAQTGGQFSYRRVHQLVEPIPVRIFEREEALVGQYLLRLPKACPDNEIAQCDTGQFGSVLEQLLLGVCHAEGRTARLGSHGHIVGLLYPQNQARWPLGLRRVADWLS